MSGSEVVGIQTGLDEGLLGTGFGIAAQIGEDFGGDDGITRHEVGVGHLVGQTQHANTDTWVVGLG